MSYKHEDTPLFLGIAVMLGAVILLVVVMLYEIHAQYECRNLGLVANVGVFKYRCLKSAYWPLSDQRYLHFSTKQVDYAVQTTANPYQTKT